MANQVKKHQSIRPCRVKYEASHPTISVRVSRYLYYELKALAATAGLSTADILKSGMEKTKAAAGDPYDQGFEDGYVTPAEEYEVT